MSSHQNDATLISPGTLVFNKLAIHTRTNRMYANVHHHVHGQLLYTRVRRQIVVCHATDTFTHGLTSHHAVPKKFIHDTRQKMSNCILHMYMYVMQLSCPDGYTLSLVIQLCLCYCNVKIIPVLDIIHVQCTSIGLGLGLTKRNVHEHVQYPEVG